MSFLRTWFDRFIPNISNARNTTMTIQELERQLLTSNRSRPDSMRDFELRGEIVR